MKTWQYILVLFALSLAKSIRSSGLPPSCTLNDFLLNGCKSGSQEKGADCAAGSSFLVTECPPNVVIVVDGSDSVSPSGYGQTLESFSREVRAVTQTFANTHIGVVLFSESIQDFRLQQRTPAEIEDLIRTVQNIPQPRRKTLLAKALGRAREMLQDYRAIESRAYNGIQSGSIIVLLTDGHTDNKKEIVQEAKLAMENGALIISLSLENPEVQLLKSISHVVQDNVKAVNWTSLVACPDRVLNPVQKGRICRDLLFVVDGSDSVLRHKETVRQYLVYTALRHRLVNNAIGVNVYGTDSQIQASDTRIRLEDDKYDLAEKIRVRLTFPTSGGTGTDRAIIQSVEMLNDDLREEPSALILITDGPTSNREATRNAIQNARSSNYPVFIIRVGTVLTDDELSFIAGGDLSNTFTVNTFTDLFNVDFDARVCEACQTRCPINARQTGQCGCTCTDPDAVYVASNNSCVLQDRVGCALPCPSDAYRATDCSCVCLDGKIFNLTTRTCVTSGCPQECPTNAQRINNCGCQCVSTNQVYNNISNTCVCSQQCPWNAQRTSNCGCQCTDTNLDYQNSTNTCVTRVCPQNCPLNSWRINNCLCQCAESNQVYNSVSNQCVNQVCPQLCPINARRTDNCGCQCVDANQVYNNTINQCVLSVCSRDCPSDARKVGSCDCQCVNSSHVYNVNTNQCESVLRQCTRTEFACENNQVAYKDCHGDCFCACSSGFAGTRCEIRLQAELCNDCYYDNGHYHAGVVGYCDMYVSCVPVGVQANSTARPTSFVPYIMSCPPGTFYITRSDGWKGCDYLANGRCAQDQCQTLTVGARYADRATCQSFWQCGADRRLVSKQCCSVGQRFDPTSSACVVDSSCPVTCGRNRTDRCTAGGDDGSDTCPFEVNPSDPNEYYFKGKPDQPQRCQATDIMNLTLCLCVTSPTPRPTVCRPVVNMTFDQPSSNVEVNVPRVPIGNAIAANFSGSDDVFLKMFAGSGFWTDYFQINLLLFLNRPVTTSQRRAVVTNADCFTGESVSITMDDKNFYFMVYQIGATRPAEIIIPYASRADRNGWLPLTLIYRKVGGAFVFSGTVGDHTEIYNGNVTLTNYIDIRTCALHLGQGYLYAGLVGYVDDFQVWRCDPRSQ